MSLACVLGQITSIFGTMVLIMLARRSGFARVSRARRRICAIIFDRPQLNPPLTVLPAPGAQTGGIEHDLNHLAIWPFPGPI